MARVGAGGERIKIENQEQAAEAEHETTVVRPHECVVDFHFEEIQKPFVFVLIHAKEKFACLLFCLFFFQAMTI